MRNASSTSRFVSGRIARCTEITSDDFATSIGDDSVCFPNVSIYPGTRIGKRVRIHSGTVIGSDGFGYARHESGAYQKIPQVGSVEIGDDVEIGSNCCIDRATLVLSIDRMRAGEMKLPAPPRLSVLKIVSFGKAW